MSRALVASRVLAVLGALWGAALIAIALTLGRCDAFGGRCPSISPPLWEDDTFGMAALGGLLITAGPYVLWQPSWRRVAVGLPVGAIAAMVIGLAARGAGAG